MRDMTWGEIEVGDVMKDTQAFSDLELNRYSLWVIIKHFPDWSGMYVDGRVVFHVLNLMTGDVTNHSMPRAYLISQHYSIMRADRWVK